MNICINFFSRFCKYFLGFPTVSNINIIIIYCLVSIIIIIYCLISIFLFPTSTKFSRLNLEDMVTNPIVLLVFVRLILKTDDLFLHVLFFYMHI